MPETLQWRGVDLWHGETLVGWIGTTDHGAGWHAALLTPLQFVADGVTEAEARAALEQAARDA